MASTVSKKRVRTSKTARRRGAAPQSASPQVQRRVTRETKVGEMTRDELRALIEEILDERAIDPDAGLEVRPEILAELREQDARVAAGERGKPLAEVIKELGLE
jgi:hypothetical protein